MIEEDDEWAYEWDKHREERKRKKSRNDYIATIGDPLPRIVQELYLNSATRFEFIDAVYDREGAIHFPFGGTCVLKHCRDVSDVWRVLILSPFPGKGWLHLRSPEDGYLITGLAKAMQFARRMQP
jgi:hypothetical protein